MDLLTLQVILKFYGFLAVYYHKLTAHSSSFKFDFFHFIDNCLLFYFFISKFPFSHLFGWIWPSLSHSTSSCWFAESLYISIFQLLCLVFWCFLYVMQHVSGMQFLSSICYISGMTSSNATHQTKYVTYFMVYLS